MLLDIEEKDPVATLEVKRADACRVFPYLHDQRQRCAFSHLLAYEWSVALSSSIVRSFGIAICSMQSEISSKPSKSQLQQRISHRERRRLCRSSMNMMLKLCFAAFFIAKLPFQFFE